MYYKHTSGTHTIDHKYLKSIYTFIINDTKNITRYGTHSIKILI